MHHRRRDGSGCHHRAAGAEIPAGARLLAAANAYQAMTQDRPHRPALAPEAAARELEVLRLVAGGLSNRQIAAALVSSPRTAAHHVQHVYTKIGVSTRAMFAMRHGLLR
jgi:HD-GYP domain-containing protein (c-di-GMP phosphodiesterase class II)